MANRLVEFFRQQQPQSAADAQALAAGLTQQAAAPRGTFAGYQGSVMPSFSVGEGLGQLGQALLARRAGKKAKEMDAQERQAIAAQLRGMAQDPRQAAAVGAITEIPLPMQQQVAANLAMGQLAPSQGDRLIGVADPGDFTPESLSRYMQSRDPADLVPVERNTVNRVNPRDYTPESLAKYMETGNLGDLVRVAPYQFGETPGGGTQRRNPVTGEVENVVSPEQGTAEAAARTGAEAEARARGEAEGKAWGAITAKATNAQGINDILDIAEPLIDVATGSGSGAMRDKVSAFFGYSGEGDQAIGQLRIVQASLMMGMPRMEGPQSDKDVELYRQAAAELGDPSVPAARKKASVATIRQLQAKYVERGGGEGYVPGQTPVIPGSAAPSKRIRVDAEGNVIGN